MSSLNISQKVDILISLIEQMHPNLYANISKDEFDEYKTREVTNYTKSQEKNYIELFAKLLAKFNDGHTKVSFSYKKLNAIFKVIDNQVYIINQDQSYGLVNSINDVSIDKIILKLKQLIPNENSDYVNYHIENNLANLNIYNLLNIGISDSMVKVSTDKDKILEVGLKTIGKKEERNYNFKAINNIGVLKYSECAEDPEYSIEELIKDIKKESNIKGMIIDVRDNQGGSSNVILPVYNYLKTKNMKCCCLMNKGTFSSGTFAIKDAKEMLGATIIGQNAGQNTCRFGDTELFTLFNCLFMSSTKEFDFRQTFNYDGPIKPDIYVPMTIEDYVSSQDKVLNKAMSMLRVRDLQK